jgi:hypothetical protein
MTPPPPETLIMKLSANELRFPLVTHTVNFDARFGSYGVFKSGQGVENFLDRSVIQANGQVSGHTMCETCYGVNMDSEDHLYSF